MNGAPAGRRGAGKIGCRRTRRGRVPLLKIALVAAVELPVKFTEPPKPCATAPPIFTIVAAFAVVPL